MVTISTYVGIKVKTFVLESVMVWRITKITNCTLMEYLYLKNLKAIYSFVQS